MADFGTMLWQGSSTLPFALKPSPKKNDEKRGTRARVIRSPTVFMAVAMPPMVPPTPWSAPEEVCASRGPEPSVAARSGDQGGATPDKAQRISDPIARNQAQF